MKEGQASRFHEIWRRYAVLQALAGASAALAFFVGCDPRRVLAALLVFSTVVVTMHVVRWWSRSDV